MAFLNLGLFFNSVFSLNSYLIRGYSKPLLKRFSAVLFSENTDMCVQMNIDIFVNLSIHRSIFCVLVVLTPLWHEIEQNLAV